jgi:hypothetical protein
MRPQIKTIIRPCVCDWQEAEMDPDQHPSFHNQIQEKEPQDVEASIQNEPDDPSQAAGHAAVRPSSQPAPGTPPDPSDGIGRSGPIALYWNRGTDGHVPDPEDHDETPKRTQRILEVLQVFRRRARALGTAALARDSFQVRARTKQLWWHWQTGRCEFIGRACARLGDALPTLRAQTHATWTGGAPKTTIALKSNADY